MKMQIRTSDLTPEQIAKEMLYEKAVKVLSQEGIKAEYISTVVSSPRDEPGFISLRGN